MGQLIKSYATGYEPKRPEYVSYRRSTATLAWIFIQVLLLLYQLTNASTMNLPELSDSTLCHQPATQPTNDCIIANSDVQPPKPVKKWPFVYAPKCQSSHLANAITDLSLIHI